MSNLTSFHHLLIPKNQRVSPRGTKRPIDFSASSRLPLGPPPHLFHPTTRKLPSLSPLDFSFFCVTISSDLLQSANRTLEGEGGFLVLVIPLSYFPRYWYLEGFSSRRRFLRSLFGGLVRRSPFCSFPVTRWSLSPRRPFLQRSCPFGWVLVRRSFSRSVFRCFTPHPPSTQESFFFQTPAKGTGRVLDHCGFAVLYYLDPFLPSSSSCSPPLSRGVSGKQTPHCLRFFAPPKSSFIPGLSEVALFITRSWPFWAFSLPFRVSVWFSEQWPWPPGFFSFFFFHLFAMD